MVNNSTNINKRNNYLSPKTYTKMTTHMKSEIQVLAWDRHKMWWGLDQLMGSQPLPLLIIGPLIAILIYINKHSDDIIHIEDVSSSE